MRAAHPATRPDRARLALLARPMSDPEQHPHRGTPADQAAQGGAPVFVRGRCQSVGRSHAIRAKLVYTA